MTTAGPTLIILGGLNGFRVRVWSLAVGRLGHRGGRMLNYYAIFAVKIPRRLFPWWLGGVFLSSCLFWQDSPPIQIALIGDSITQGRRGNPAQQVPPTISWRYPFWQKLVDQGINVDLVGSQRGGFEGDPPWPDYKGRAFDPDHEARWGAPTEAIAAQVATGLNQYTPDLALILLGTNDVRVDQKSGKDPVQETKADLTRLIVLLRRDNPNVVIVIGEPFQSWEPFPAIALGYQDLAAQLSTPRSPILTVATRTDWISNPEQEGTCTVDWVHPNAKGDQLIAEAFYQAIKPYVNSPTRSRQSTPQ